MDVQYPSVMDKPKDARELGRMISELPDLPEVDRLHQARALVDEAKRVLSATADEVIAVAARGATYEQVAAEFGISVAWVNKAVSRHRARVNSQKS
jgi:DNA-directed RNA polymerase specialized sigma24 family protein